MAFTTNQSAVAELYIASLGRSPEMTGLDYWVGRLEATDATALTLAQIQDFFMDKTIPEVEARFPTGSTPATTVSNMYLNVFERTADTSGQEYWEGRLAGTIEGQTQLTEGTLLRAMLDEAKNNTTDAATLTANITTAELSYDTAVETAAVAAYDAALVTYNAAVATAATSKAAADAAALTVDSVALATASSTAAATAKTDADAVVTAAAALTTTSAATPSSIDDSVATTNVAAAAAAQTVAATLVTTAATAVTTAQAAADAAAATGTTFTLTTDSDMTLFGTAKSDTWNGDQNTYNSGDIIVDSSTVDNDTVTVTATDDITATATVVGVENVNFNLDAVVSSAATVNATTFSVAADNISAGTITAAVTKAGSTVTAASVTNLKDGVAFNTDLATVTATTAADANVTYNLNGTTANTLSAGSASDDVTINSAANLDLAVALAADENVVINVAGDFTSGANELVATTNGSLNNLTIDADGKITMGADSAARKGDVTLTAGDDIAALLSGVDGDVVVTTDGEGGDITAATFTAATTVTMTATGDAADVTDTLAAVNDGSIDALTATAATTVVLTAADTIAYTDLEAATDLTMSIGNNSAAANLLNTVSSVKNLTLSGTNANGVTYTFEDEANNASGTTTDGAQDGLASLETITFTGSNDVTMNVSAADLITATAGLPAGTTKIVATDNSTATSTIELNTATGGNTDLDISALAVDEIVFKADTGTEVYTVANGATLINGIDQTTNAIVLSAATNPGNAITVKVEDDTVTTTSNDITGLTLTNIATLNLELNDESTTGGNLTTGAITIGATNTVNMTGVTDTTVASTDAGTFNASTYTGDITLSAVNATTDYTLGTGDDTITATDVDFTVDGGTGTDTLALAAGGDYSNNTLSITSIEVLDTTAGNAIFAATQLDGESYVISGGNAVAVNVASTTGEVANLSAISNSTAVAITGNTGNDSLTGSSTTAMSISGGAGDDVITGGAAADALYGDNDGTKDVQTMSVIASTGTVAATLNYAGHTVSFTSTTGAAGDIDAIQAAIAADSVMSKLVSATDGTNADDITFTALIDGAIADATITTADGTLALADDGVIADVTGTAASSGDDTITAGNGADFIYGGTGADSINLTETISAVDTVLYNLITDGSAVSAADATFADFDTITGFTLAKDLIDVTAITAAAAEFEVLASTAGSTDLIDLADSEYTNVNAVTTFLEDANTVVNNGGDAYVVAVTFSDFTAIYAINDGAVNDTVESDEIYLLGTVDAVLTATEFTVA